MPSGRIYGLGERQREFSLVPGTWTMWANGRETPYDDGMGGKQTYGVHPFALIQTQAKDEWMGIFFRNSNIQSPVITEKVDGNFSLSYVSTGGLLEMYFFTKGSSKEIIQAYHNLIGKPKLTPFWSMGW
jgi:alpha-glucosidase (family GH31 glycosyl hydrolase)